MSDIIVSRYPPVSAPDNLSLAQFMNDYNPDNVLSSKVVHVDALTDRGITYGGLREQAAKCAWGLQHKFRLEEGATVLAVLSNSTDFVLLAHSVWWAGGVFSPLNSSSLTKDVVHALTILEPTHVVCDSARLATVQAAIGIYKPKHGPIPQVMTVHDRQDDLPLFPDDVAGQSTHDRSPPYNLNGKNGRQTTAVICFSSGTTGRIKGVRISHYNVISNQLQARTTLPDFINASHREVFFPPYCHIYGMSVVVVGAMWVGSFACGMPSFDLELFCSKMAEHKATFTHIVPPVAALLASSELTKAYDLSAIRVIVVSAAPMKRDLQMRLKARFGSTTNTLQGYGMSECSPTVMHQRETDEDFVGSAGKLISGTEARLVDPSTGQDVPRGAEGELWVRGPQVMQGYVGDEEATRNTFSADGQWLRTGDVMKIDENDNFWITDRLKELIKYKGFQVAPSELEDLLLRHPDVTDAAVCSIYDDGQATELPLAYVSLRPQLLTAEAPQKERTLTEIQDWANKQLAGYKKIRGGVLHLQNLPKTPTGKILRKDLPANVQKARQSQL